MPKIEYQKIKFRRTTAEIIDKVNSVIEEYRAKGYSLTLRQVYYQMVARDFIENTPKSYKNMGNIVNDARLAGLIDWEAITDRTRSLSRYSSWKNPSSVIESAAFSYELNRWQGQPCYVEVWEEKDALKEIVENGCCKTRTPFFSCRGYTSQSEMWEAARRFKSKAGRDCIIIHLGDHDPSGLDMTRDIQERLQLFGATVKVHRIALTMAQVQQYNPPPNPAKTTDTRFKQYISQYGGESWELDALEPDLLAGLIHDTITQYLDLTKFNAVCKQEQEEKEELYMLADRYHEAITCLRGA